MYQRFVFRSLLFSAFFFWILISKYYDEHVQCYVTLRGSRWTNGEFWEKKNEKEKKTLLFSASKFCSRFFFVFHFLENVILLFWTPSLCATVLPTIAFHLIVWTIERASFFLVCLLHFNFILVSMKTESFVFDSYILSSVFFICCDLGKATPTLQELFSIGTTFFFRMVFDFVWRKYKTKKNIEINFSRIVWEFNVNSIFFGMCV